MLAGRLVIRTKPKRGLELANRRLGHVEAAISQTQVEMNANQCRVARSQIQSAPQFGHRLLVLLLADQGEP